MGFWSTAGRGVVTLRNLRIDDDGICPRNFGGFRIFGFIRNPFQINSVDIWKKLVKILPGSPRPLHVYRTVISIFFTQRSFVLLRRWRNLYVCLNYFRSAFGIDIIKKIFVYFCFSYPFKWTENSSNRYRVFFFIYYTIPIPATFLYFFIYYDMV